MKVGNKKTLNMDAIELSRDKPMSDKPISLNARGRITISCFIYIANFSSIEFELHTPHNRTKLKKARICKENVKMKSLKSRRGDARIDVAKVPARTLKALSNSC